MCPGMAGTGGVGDLERTECCCEIEHEAPSEHLLVYQYESIAAAA